MKYSHPKFKHTQEVGENETVKRRLLERAGWKPAKDGETQPANDSTVEPKPVISDGDKPDEKRKDEIVMPAHLPTKGQPPAKNVKHKAK